MKSVVYSIWLVKDKAFNEYVHDVIPIIGLTIWARIWRISWIRYYDNHLTFKV